MTCFDDISKCTAECGRDAIAYIFLSWLGLTEDEMKSTGADDYNAACVSLCAAGESLPLLRDKWTVGKISTNKSNRDLHFVCKSPLISLIYLISSQNCNHSSFRRFLSAGYKQNLLREASRK